MFKSRAPLLLTGLLLCLNSSYLHASPGHNLGTGNNTCSHFIQVVDGQWSSPLNAIQFNAYLAWAHGMISGFNHYQQGRPLNPEMETLKLDLVDRCRDSPESSYASVVKELIEDYLNASQ